MADKQLLDALGRLNQTLQADDGHDLIDIGDVVHDLGIDLGRIDNTLKRIAESSAGIEKWLEIIAGVLNRKED